jgi:NADH:ubiquinone oxidoreductase subunit F (NADH-binding)
MWHKRCSEKLQAESLPGETRNTQRKILFFLSLGVYVNPAMMANHEKKWVVPMTVS